MKPLPLIEKDKIIIKSVIEQDFPYLFNNLSPVFGYNIFYILGYPQKFDFEHEQLCKMFRQEIKTILDTKDYKLLIDFFEAIADKSAIMEEENRKAIFYISTFLFRFLFNLYYLNNDSIAEIIDQKLQSSIDINTPLFNNRNLTIIKSFADKKNDEKNQKYLTIISELFLYLIKQKDDPDNFREIITHGITGCFLIENENIEKTNILSNHYKFMHFIDLFNEKDKSSFSSLDEQTHHNDNDDDDEHNDDDDDFEYN